MEAGTFAKLGGRLRTLHGRPKSYEGLGGFYKHEVIDHAEL